MITLYGMARSRAQRCIWMLEELGLDYQLERVSPFDGGARRPEYLAVNPNGKIPALRDGELVLWESMAINLYLADRYGGGLWPATPENRGQAFQWSHWALGEMEGHLFVLLRSPRADGGRGERPEAGRAAETKLERPLAILNGALAGSPWLAGEHFSVADLNVAAVAAWGLWAGMDFSGLPALENWLGTCLDRPAAKKMISARNEG